MHPAFDPSRNRVSRDLGVEIPIVQAPMGNLHLVSTVLALLSYFSRRPGLMRLVGRLVSLATLVSLGLASLAAGQRGNIWVVAGTGVMALAASLTRSLLYFAMRLVLFMLYAYVDVQMRITHSMLTS